MSGCCMLICLRDDAGKASAHIWRAARQRSSRMPLFCRLIMVRWTNADSRRLPPAAPDCDASRMTKLISRAVVLVALLLTGCARNDPAAGAPSPLSPRGHLMIVGGGPIPREVTKRFVDLAAQRGKPRIAVLPMASAVPSTGPDKVAELRSLGAEAFVLVINRSNAESDSVQ